jgi:hypothetical protein
VAELIAPRKVAIVPRRVNSFLPVPGFFTVSTLSGRGDLLVAAAREAVL